MGKYLIKNQDHVLVLYNEFTVIALARYHYGLLNNLQHCLVSHVHNVTMNALVLA